MLSCSQDVRTQLPKPTTAQIFQVVPALPAYLWESLSTHQQGWDDSHFSQCSNVQQCSSDQRACWQVFLFSFYLWQLGCDRHEVTERSWIHQLWPEPSCTKSSILRAENRKKTFILPSSFLCILFFFFFAKDVQTIVKPNFWSETRKLLQTFSASAVCLGRSYVLHLICWTGSSLKIWAKSKEPFCKKCSISLHLKTRRRHVSNHLAVSWQSRLFLPPLFSNVWREKLHWNIFPRTSVYIFTYPELKPTKMHVQSGPPCVLLQQNAESWWRVQDASPRLRQQYFCFLFFVFLVFF